MNHSTISQACYKISLPQPGSSCLPVEIVLTGEFDEQVRLGLMQGAAPGLAPTVDYYRIEDSLCISADGTPIKDFCLKRAEEFGGFDELLIPIPPSCRDACQLELKYELDTSQNERLGSDQIGSYKDRVILKSHYAVLRGDVLFFPLENTVFEADKSDAGREIMCNEEHAESRQDSQDGDNPRVKYRFQVCMPDEWVLHVNAEHQTVDGAVEWEREDYAGYPVRWFSIAGQKQMVLCRDIEINEESVVRRLVAVKSKYESANGKGKRQKNVKPRFQVPFPADAALNVAERFIDDFDDTFGVDMLKHVQLPFDQGYADSNFVYLFLVPYPKKMEFGSGGQYARGTTYAFYTMHQPDPLAHTGAHEYFHVYNDGALHSAPNLNNWFAEGYTEVQATLSYLRLHVDSDLHRENQYKLEMGRNWVTMQGNPGLELEKRLRADGLIVFQGRLPRPDPPIGRTPFDQFPRRGGYARLIRGRSFLVMHMIAMIFESGAPHRRGFDNWFKSLYRDFGVCTATSSRVPNYRDFRDTALENAGPAMFDLDSFLSRFVEDNEEITYEELVYWMRWAEEREIFGTLFSPPESK